MPAAAQNAGDLSARLQHILHAIHIRIMADDLTCASANTPDTQRRLFKELIARVAAQKKVTWKEAQLSGKRPS